MGLIYLSPVRWNSYAQRPHRFAEWFHSRRREEVLWIDPYPTRLPSLSDFRRASLGGEGLENSAVRAHVPSWLSIIRPRALPIEPLPGSGRLNGLFWKGLFKETDRLLGRGGSFLAIGKPSELALRLLLRYCGIPSLYDAMDDFPAFYRGRSKTSIRRREKEIAARVSRITVSSTGLARRFESCRQKLSLVLNACDPCSLGNDFVGSARGKPVLGYVGTIGHWFDWHLVLALADANPSLSFRLIGPLHSPPPGRMPENIELLPACSHPDAIRAMRKFSIGLIPFKRSALTLAVDPIKFYEYRALGLPVITSRFGEMALRDGQPGLYFVDRHTDLTGVVESALAYDCPPDAVHAFRNANSWEARFDGIGILS